MPSFSFSNSVLTFQLLSLCVHFFSFLHHSHLPHHKERKEQKGSNKKKKKERKETMATETNNLLALLLDDLQTFGKLICSHPLQCAYLLFFSPYIISLLSFLSPLLLSTSLLLLALLSASPDCLPGSLPLLPDATWTMISKTLKPTKDEDEVHDDDDDKNAMLGLLEQLCSMVSATAGGDEDDDSMTSFQAVEECITSKAEAEAERVPEKSKEEEEKTNAITTEAKFQREGSMRKEKEWKRTLACKLYEERMTFKLCEEMKAEDGCEDMDMLWEAYESIGDCSDLQKSSSKKCKSKSKIERENAEKIEEDDVYDEEEESEVRTFCCLQALRLSAGKMSLASMGRKNLMKIPKAMTMIGFFRPSEKQTNSTMNKKKKKKKKKS